MILTLLRLPIALIIVSVASIILIVAIPIELILCMVWFIFSYCYIAVRHGGSLLRDLHWPSDTPLLHKAIKNSWRIALSWSLGKERSDSLNGGDLQKRNNPKSEAFALSALPLSFAAIMWGLGWATGFTPLFYVAALLVVLALALLRNEIYPI